MLAAFPCQDFHLPVNCEVRVMLVCPQLLMHLSKNLSVPVSPLGSLTYSKSNGCMGVFLEWDPAYLLLHHEWPRALATIC